MSTHAAVIPLALHSLNIAAQIYLVCFLGPSGMLAAGTAPYTQRLRAAQEMSVPGKIPLPREKPVSAPYSLLVTGTVQHRLHERCSGTGELRCAGKQEAEQG